MKRPEPNPLPTRLLEGNASVPLFSNLTIAFLFLPGDTRRDMRLFYAFCRVVDDIADDPAKPADQKERELEAWRRAAAGETAFPEDLEELLERKTVPRKLLAEIIDGVSSDIHHRGMADFVELAEYCGKVAVAVGLASNRITGCTTPEAEPFAENLGMALQLTNILRDLGEDLAMGRVYIPRDELAQFEVTPQMLRETPDDPRVLPLLRMQAERALSYFDAVSGGAPPADRAALRAAEMMRKVYFRLLQKMQNDRLQVLGKRYRLNAWEKFSACVGMG